MENHKISIIIPTHKRSNYLDFELEQIFKQEDVSFEIIVINDIENDNKTKSVVEKYSKITYIEDNKLEGPSLKRKVGYKIAKGEYIYTPDDDDYLIDNMFFKKAIEKFDQYKGLAMVSGQ